MFSQIEDLARRLEQQLNSFEKLHGDELKAFQERLNTYQRLQNDELQQLGDQLRQLKAEIVALKAEAEKRAVGPAPSAQGSVPAELTVTRRDFLTGRMSPSTQDKA